MGREKGRWQWGINRGRGHYSRGWRVRIPAVMTSQAVLADNHRRFLVTEYASETGMTANNAAVRAHRARQALRRRLAESCGVCAEHGCVDCSCGAGARPPL
jgi:hypothetical protein